MAEDLDLLPKVIVAEWLSRRYPLEFRIGDSFFIAGLSTKVAYTLGGLLRATNLLSKSRAARCTSRVYRKDYRNSRYLFSVKCFEDYSGGPQIARIQLLPGETERISERQVRVSCSCEAWKYWGPDYHGKTKDYLEGRPRGPATAPTRNPELKRHFYVCKHIVASAPSV